MEAAELRRAFAQFLGDERFRKFVRTGWQRGRLRYWQEQEWRRFTSLRPDLAVPLAKLEIALRICELHGDELQSGEAQLFHGCIDYTTTYLDQRNRLFPHAENDLVSTEGRPMQGDRIVVWFCPSCRKAKERWNSRHKR